MIAMEQPDRIDRYGILRTLGHGGFGTVYLAIDPLTGQRIALKVQTRSSAGTFRFRQEYLILSMLDHPGLPAVYRLGQTGSLLWLTQEYIVGLPPSVYVGAIGAVGEARRTGRVLTVLISICEGLSALHGAGLVHCDLKSANVLVEPGGQARILDLGGAKVLEEGTPIGRGQSGTWSHTAPEQLLREEITPRCDLYSLGVMGYRLLTGERPYAGSTREAVLASMATPLAGPVPGISEAVSAVVMSLLSLNPSDRPQSAVAARDALIRCSGVSPAALEKPPHHHDGARRTGRLLLDAALPGGMLRVGGSERAAVLAGLAADAVSVGVTVLVGRFVDGVGLEGIGAVAQQAAAMLEADPPGVSRAVLAEADMTAPVRRHAHLEHGVIATLLALAGTGPVAVILAEIHQADPAASRLIVSLRQWARKKNAPLVLLAGTAVDPEVVVDPPAVEAGREDAGEALSRGLTLCGAGRFTEARAVLGEALLGEPCPQHRHGLWLAMARIHLWLHQPGAARLALVLAGEREGLERRQVRAALALSSGRSGEAVALLEGDESLWAEVHRAFIFRDQADPMGRVRPETLSAPGHTMLRLLLHQAQIEHALRQRQEQRALAALLTARQLCRRIEAVLDEADRIGWRLYGDVAGLG